ncbi:trypsin-like peptidase domain-containing protein [Candidatus Woesebacteria bacterium]|nr:MAG: trypsin-like peptidase domain-containing protein [Candidatus Woesebacteria bacterium]
MKKINLKIILLIFSSVVFLFVGLTAGGLYTFKLKNFDFGKFIAGEQRTRIKEISQEDIVEIESAIVMVAEEVSPSVVTVVIQTPQRSILKFDPFSGGISRSIDGGTPQDIGTGFVISEDGLIVTNKHVVSENQTYKVVTQDDKEYEVKTISRDPSNDIAIIKIDANNLKPVELGDSDQLKVGQYAIAIGTALGEFRHTVTTGVVSGLGRGITAGSAYEGFVETLDNVIQTDAAINPGNSGGPLLNSQGQVIGVNVAVAQGAQNIGFAIPINIVKDRLNEFNKNGEFPQKAYLGVQYQIVSKRAAIANNVPEGIFVIDVVDNSPADKSGIEVNDIVTEINGTKLNEENDLAKVIAGFKPGDEVTLAVWRNEDTLAVKVILEKFPE